jgi:cellulose synthase/poly-beta-1,6-N-acetylglucosamine synthase-like glycosyltransferase
MTRYALLAAGLPVALFIYAYAGYPLVLQLVAAGRRRARRGRAGSDWPTVSITIPAFNEEARIRDTLDAVLALDYPVEKRDILVISDASSDRTDEIVSEYRDRGVELLRMPVRRGKSAAENAAGRVVRGEIVVNTDASVRLRPNSLKRLVRAFDDPSVGVASGRDVSVGDLERESNQGESGYVGYEMWVRGLETRVHSIVGASGCFYGIRRSLYVTDFPEHLSRDFGAALLARLAGYRSVSVDDALCLVPRTTGLRAELRRKVRTMARGLETLWYLRRLLNPIRYGLFAWMLFSHKLARWLVYLALPPALVGLSLLSAQHTVAAMLVAGGAIAVALGTLGLRWRRGRAVPAMFAIPGFALAAVLAGVLAWVRVFRRQRAAMWEPTRRPA